MRTARLLSPVLVAGLIVPVSAAHSAAAADQVSLSLLVELPLQGGQAVDIYDGTMRVASGVGSQQFLTVGKVAPGTREFTMVSAGDPVTSPDNLKSTVTLKAGTDATVVIAMAGDTTAVAFVPFTNVTAPTPAGKARVTVRHVAGGYGSLDVLRGGEPVMTGLENTLVGSKAPQQQSIFVAAGPSAITVFENGTSTQVAALDQELKAGFSYTVYLETDYGTFDQLKTLVRSAASGVQAPPTTAPPITAPPTVAPPTTAPPTVAPPSSPAPTTTVTVTVRALSSAALPISVAAGDGGTAPTGDPVLPLIALGLLGAGAAALSTRRLVKK